MRLRIFLLALFAVSAASAKTLTLELENDLLNDSDKFYTHGTRLTYFDQLPVWAGTFMDKCFFFNKPREKQFGLAVGQSMYTPTDISIPYLQEDERPYGGWLYGGLIFKSIGSNSINYLEADVGVVGPHSYAEDTQKWVHEHTDNQEPMGWDNQLNDEPGLDVIYKQKWKMPLFDVGGFGAQFNPHAGGSLGNVFTYLNAGGEIRCGYNLPEDFLMYSNVEPTFAPRGKKPYAFVSTGVDGRAVARNIFLDGNTFSDSHSVDKRNFVGDWKTGVSVGLGRMRVDFMHILRSQEFYGQDDDYIEFDSASLSWTF